MNHASEVKPKNFGLVLLEVSGLFIIPENYVVFKLFIESDTEAINIKYGSHIFCEQTHDHVRVLLSVLNIINNQEQTESERQIVQGR